MMKKTLALLMTLAVVLLGMSSCSDNDEKDLLAFSFKGGTVKALGPDSLTYDANCNVDITVSKDNRLTMTISNLTLNAKNSKLPVTLQLTSDQLSASMRDINYIAFKGDKIASNIFVITNIEGNINLAEHSVHATWLLNGSQQMTFDSKIDVQALLNYLALMQNRG